MSVCDFWLWGIWGFCGARIEPKAFFGSAARKREFMGEWVLGSGNPELRR